jgi:hypothetical protein
MAPLKLFDNFAMAPLETAKVRKVFVGLTRFTFHLRLHSLTLLIIALLMAGAKAAGPTNPQETESTGSDTPYSVTPPGK